MSNQSINEQTIELYQRLGIDKQNSDPHEVINKLAQLDTIMYESYRKLAAKVLNFRENMLDHMVATKRECNHANQLFNHEQIALWSEPVDGIVLFEYIRALLKRFVICEEPHYTAVALWIMFTYTTEYAQICPILFITAPEKRCGKSVLLELVSLLCFQPCNTSNISSAALYRVIEKNNVTLIIDEVDTFIKGNDALRGILNSGHTRVNAYIIRVNPFTYEPENFSTFCPKALAGIGMLSDTNMDRSVIIGLRRKLSHETVDKIRFVDKSVFTEIKSKILRWEKDHRDVLSRSQPVIPKELNDRAADSWEALLNIADCIGGKWGKIARQTALALDDENETESIGTELLSDIREIFALKKVDRISSADLLNALFEDEDKPWKTWNRGFGMKAHQLAKKIGEFGIKSKDMRFGGHGVLKGYSLDMFNDVFKRYLDEPAMTQNQISNSILNASNDGNNYRSNVINLKITSNNFSFKNITKMCDFQASDEYDDYMNDPDYIEFQNSLDSGNDDEPDDQDDSLIGYAN